MCKRALHVYVWMEIHRTFLGLVFLLLRYKLRGMGNKHAWIKCIPPTPSAVVPRHGAETSCCMCDFVLKSASVIAFFLFCIVSSSFLLVQIQPWSYARTTVLSVVIFRTEKVCPCWYLGRLSLFVIFFSYARNIDSSCIPILNIEASVEKQGEKKSQRDLRYCILFGSGMHLEHHPTASWTLPLVTNFSWRNFSQLAGLSVLGSCEI